MSNSRCTVSGERFTEPYTVNGKPLTELLKEAAVSLQKAGVPRPRWSAQWLLAKRLGIEPIELYLDAPCPNPRQMVQFQADVAARANGMPLQYLLGSASFYGREFAVGPGVFIPRPETEILVEATLALQRNHHSGVGIPRTFVPPSERDCTRHLPSLSRLSEQERIEEAGSVPARSDDAWSPHSPRVVPLNVVDVGTGSGAIAITLALECPGLKICATDRSSSALSFARRNAIRHQAPVTFLQADLLGSFAFGSVDLIVANLPYLNPAEASSWPRELHWEPRLAQDGGTKGLFLINESLKQAHSVVKPGGFVVLEIGAGQAKEVCAHAANNSFGVYKVIPDLNGLDRVVVLWKS